MYMNPPKTNMDTQNDGSEKVTPFKNGKCWYLSWISGVHALRVYIYIYHKNSLFQAQVASQIHIVNCQVLQISEEYSS